MKQQKAIEMFFISKKVEGLSSKSLAYYRLIINGLMEFCEWKDVAKITTDDIRYYLASRAEENNLSKCSMDNMRRVFNSLFGWLADEEYITKNPAKRIKKIKQESRIKKPFTEEELERLRDAADNERNLAIIDMFASTGMRVGELVLLNRKDVDFGTGEIIVFGKGGKERTVYLNAKAKIHLQNYLDTRKDSEHALFVSLTTPHKRLMKGGIETMLREIGKKAQIQKVHPHRFRRTAATFAINRGMPIEQVQDLLGHARIETTTCYAIVNEKNVKTSHGKYLY